MNICYIIYFDGNRKTGHAAHARGLASALLELGHTLQVIAPEWVREPFENLFISRARQFKKNGFYTLSFGISSFIVLFMLLIKNRPDVIYARYFNFLFLLLPLIKIFRIPFVVEHNADVYAENRIYKRNYFSCKFHLFSERLLLAGSDGSIVVTQSIINSWNREKVSPASSIVIRNGVNTDIYSAKDSLRCKAELGLDQSYRYIGFVGSFGSIQGINVLLKSFSLLYANDPSLNLLLVGADRTELLEMKNTISEMGLEGKICLVGQVSEDIAAKYISACDVCVAPYTAGALEDIEQSGPGAAMKGDPLKIYAYMACGKPVVATYFREAGSFLENIGAGLATKPDDPVDLAEKIRNVLSDNTLSLTMGKNGLAFVRAQGSWKSAAQKTICFIEEIIDKK